MELGKKRETPDEDRRTSGALISPAEMRHILGRLTRAMDAISEMQQYKITRRMPSQEVLTKTNIAVYLSAADVGPLLKEVEILRRSLLSVTEYAKEVSLTGTPEQVETITTVIGLASLEMSSIVNGENDG